MKTIQNLPLVLMRGLRFAWACVVAFGDYFLRILFRGRSSDQAHLARWCQRTSQRFLGVLNVTYEYSGTVPKDGVVVCNHLSYLDILVLAATSPMTFVAKYQVKFWPVFGWFALLSRTLFLRRECKSHAKELSNQFARVVDSDVLLTLFPEGTSTNGSIVKPFHSTLFQSVAKNGWQSTPAWLRYSMADGSVEEEICYIDDMTFLPHFLNLLACDAVHAQLVYGAPAPSGLNRKELARYLHNQVCRIAAEHSGIEPLSNPQVEWRQLPELNPG
ncbi:MAG: lysophospholipid acyltransferase family protein [Limisphaerales bacterium]